MSARLNKKISLDTLVSMLFTNYGVVEDGWRGDLDSWVLGCFRSINNEALFPLAIAKDLEIVDFKIKVPCVYEELEKVTRGNNILNFLSYNPSVQVDRPFSRHTAMMNGCYVDYPYIYFATETGYVDVHYYKTYDEEGQLHIPAISKLLDYIMIIVVKHLTLRGFKHPILTYETLVFHERQYRQGAINACRHLTPEETFQSFGRYGNLPSTY